MDGGELSPSLSVPFTSVEKAALFMDQSVKSVTRPRGYENYEDWKRS